LGSLNEFAFILLFSFALALGAYALASRGVFARVQKLRVSNARANQTLWILFFLYVIEFSILAIVRHETLHSNWDLAIFDQVVWNSLHGRLFVTTLILDSPSLLGHHFAPILLALVPLYAVWADARMLLIAQSFILASAVFPIFWTARAQIGNAFALLSAFAFFLFPALEYVNLYDFHEITFATPLLALALFLVLRRRYLPMSVTLGVALLVKEELALVVAAFGIFIFLIQREWRVGAFWTGAGGAIFFLLLMYVIPFFYGQEYRFANRYIALGKSVPEIVQTVFTQPDQVWQMLVTPGKVEFVLHLFAPLGLLALLAPEIILIALPTFAYLLLSDSGVQTSIRSQYTAVLIPVLFFAALIGAQRLLMRASWSRRVALALFLLGASIASFYLHAPAPLARNFPNDPSPVTEFPSADAFSFDARARAGRALVARVPPDAVVLTAVDHTSQFSTRQFIFEFPTIADYRQADFLFAEKNRFWYKLHKPIWDAWLATGYFEIAGETENFLLAQRRAPERALHITFGDQLALRGIAIPHADALRGGMTLRPVTFWRADRQIETRYKLIAQVVDARGHLWAEEAREPHDGVSPTNQWRVGQIIGEQFSLRLPVMMPPGEYQIAMGVRAFENDEIFLAPLEAVVATVVIAKNKEAFTASDLAKDYPIVAQFSDWQEIRLLGFVPVREYITPSEILPIGLYWKARAQPQGDYRVAIQLRDASGKIALEQTSRPANDAYPTMRWDAGEVLLDWHDVNVPENFARGTYDIWVVLRDAATNRAIGESRIASLSVVK